MAGQSESGRSGTAGGGVIIRPAVEADLEALNRIFNNEVLRGTATWDEEPWSIERRRAWLAEHDDSTPVLVAEADGLVAGFAYLSYYRRQSGYRFTRENTVYVDPPHHRRGIGRRLLAALIAEARRAGMHAIIAMIEAENEASIALHRELGFEAIGRLREVGFKFGRWLDDVEMLLLLDDEPR